MKSYFFLFALLFSITFFSNCTKTVDTPAVLTELEAVKAGTKLSSGAFASGAHTTSGTATLYKNKTTGAVKLVLETLKTDSGPDLYIYLAKDKTAKPFVDLGKIKGIDGTYIYDITDANAITGFNTALVWCKAFSVNFGSADLK
jgi:Electron transfer DM13